MNKMLHIPLHQNRSDETYDKFLVVLKIHGDAIHIWTQDETQSIYETHSLRIFCHDSDNQEDYPGSDIQVFVLGALNNVMKKSGFQHQQPLGQPIKSTDLAIFKTSPVASSRKVSYAINVGVSKLSTSMEDLNEKDCKKIGAAYLYLDSKFATQGTQRMQIISTQSLVPIGHVQIDYLIIKNAIAYGVSVPRPKWFSQVVQLDAGHRGSGTGCRADLPGSIIENTVASFNYAAKHGADMCELDVMCTSDGIPVVYHNYSLDTTQPNATQIDELTLEELRDLKWVDIHDKNCKHELNISNVVLDRSSRPFPTLKEVLLEVDKSCALNIELKWPQLLPNGKNEAKQYREINDFVDRILNCIYENSNGRAIILSTLNADIAIMLRLKQSQYLVLFLTTGDSQRFNDPATKTILNAIHFAYAFDLAGINPNSAYLNEYLVRCAQDRGLLVYAWGKIGSAQEIKELKRTGLNGVIYDRIDLIKPRD